MRKILGISRRSKDQNTRRISGNLRKFLKFY